MNSYLALVPDAPDAQQARDQVIIWQAEQQKRRPHRLRQPRLLRMTAAATNDISRRRF